MRVSSPASTVSRYFTVHVTGPVCGPVSVTLDLAEFGRRIRALIDSAQTLARFRGTELRLLLGSSPAFDFQVAAISRDTRVPFHVLGAFPGHGHPIIGAERELYVGSDPDSIDVHKASQIANEACIAYADAVWFIGESGSEITADFRTRDYLIQWLFTGKPVFRIGASGEVVCSHQTCLSKSAKHVLKYGHVHETHLREMFTDTLGEESIRAAIDESMSRKAPCADTPSHSSRDGGWSRSSAGRVDATFMRLFSGQLLAKKGNYVPEPVEDSVIGRQFEKSDTMANHASGRYRDLIWLVHGAGSGAVFAAVAGAIELWTGTHNPFWAIVELALVGFVIAAVSLANLESKNWHGRWIRSRYMAEQLRYLSFTAPLMVFCRPFLEAPWSFDCKEVKLSSPEGLHLQGALIAEGLPTSGPQSRKTAFNPESLQVDYQRICERIQSQITYHRKRKHSLHHVHTNLERFSLALFWLTAASVVLHFVVHADWLLIGTAFLPSLGAAFHGLMGKLELLRLAEKSAVTADSLEGLLQSKVIVDEARPWDNWLRLRELARDAAGIMSDENGQWQQLLLSQKLGYE